MLRIILFVIRLVSYAALAFVLSGIAAVTFISLTGVCPRFDEGGVQCSSGVYANIAGFGIFVLLISVFTLIPLALAIAGFLFLILDLVGLVRRRRSSPPPIPPRG